MWITKTRWEKWHNHAALNWWSPPVPCMSMGHYNSLHPGIPWISCQHDSIFKKQEATTDYKHHGSINKLHTTTTAVGKDVLGFDASELGLFIPFTVEPPCLCTWLASLSLWSCWLVTGVVMLSCDSSESRYKSSAHMWTSRRFKQAAFFTIPEALHEDPWVSRHYHIFVTRNNCGHDAQSDSVHLAFTCWT